MNKISILFTIIFFILLISEGDLLKQSDATDSTPVAKAQTAVIDAAPTIIVKQQPVTP